MLERQGLLVVLATVVGCVGPALPPRTPESPSELRAGSGPAPAASAGSTASGAREEGRTGREGLASRTSPSGATAAPDGNAAAGVTPGSEPLVPKPVPKPPCPDEMALLPGGICIDRWEGSLVVMGAAGEEKPWSPFQTVGRVRDKLRAVSAPGVIPQGYISGMRAQEACENAGKRLCTSDEWLSACRGPSQTTYPYGNRRQPHMCNDDGRAKHPVADLTERLGLAPEQMWRDSMEHPMINQLPNTLRKTGERGSCTNAYGVYDMVGNLHEWVADEAGTFRGGFYMDTRINGEGCLYATTAHNKRYHDYSTGFRCCKDAGGAE